MKTINGKYSVCDCEHMGDIRSAVSYIQSLGCKVNDTFWDGTDCGEAYVAFTTEEGKFPSLYKKLGNCTTWDADINDYIDLTKYALDNCKLVSTKELFQLSVDMGHDFSNGFWNRMPMHIFFEIKDGKDTAQDIIRTIGKKPVCHAIRIVDGTTYMHLLFTANVEDMKRNIAEKVEEELLKKKRIYGKCNLEHDIARIISARRENFTNVMEAIKQGKALKYCHLTSWMGKAEVITLEKEQYNDNDGNFMPSVNINGKRYTVV